MPLLAVKTLPKIVVVSFPETVIVVFAPDDTRAGSVGFSSIVNFLLKAIVFDDVSLVPSPSVFANTATLDCPLPRIVIDTSPLKVVFVLLLGSRCICEMPVPDFSVSTLIANVESASDESIVPLPVLALSFSMRIPYPLATASV